MKEKLSLLLAAVFLAGCSFSGNNDEAKFTEAMTNQYKDLKLNIYSTSSFNSRVNYGRFDETTASAWEEYMLNKYGIIINVQRPPSLILTSIDGLYLVDSNTIFSFWEEQQILPLEDYLANNKTWNALPEEFRKRFERNGHIWAIPKSTQTTLTVASIRTDWLKEAGQEMPTTLEELFSVGKAVVKTNSSEKRYFVGCRNGVVPEIFNANGLYLSGDTSSVAYNPQKRVFEDAMAQPKMADTLQTLRKFYTNGLMDVDSFFFPDKIYQDSLKGSYGIVETSPGKAKYSVGFEWALAQNDSTDVLKNYNKISEIYEPLTLYSADNPKTFSDDPNGYVLPLNSSDPQQVVNAFVDLAFGSLGGYLDCTIGQSENYSLNSDASIVKTKPENLANTYPDLVDALDLIGSKYCIVKQGENTKLVMKCHEDAVNYDDNYIKKHTADGSLIKIPAWYQNNASYIPSYEKIIQSSNYSVEDYLKMYSQYIKSDNQYVTDYFNKSILLK